MKFSVVMLVVTVVGQGSLGGMGDLGHSCHAKVGRRCGEADIADCFD